MHQIEYLLKRMYDMKNENEVKEVRLDRIITVRLTGDDYKALLNLSKARGSDVSKVIRTMTKPIVDLTVENNRKSK
jgi:hypothetical protein